MELINQESLKQMVLNFLLISFLLQQIKLHKNQSPLLSTVVDWQQEHPLMSFKSTIVMMAGVLLLGMFNVLSLNQKNALED